jgi:hypothetical protein
MSKPQLRKYLDGLSQPYDDLSPELDSELRQMLWGVLLKGGLLSVCRLDGQGGLRIIKQHGGLYQLKDSKTFVAGIFFTINKYLNEDPSHQLMRRVVEVRQIILLALHELTKISDRLALDQDHKSQKGKFKIPPKGKINQLQKDIRSWTNGLLKGVSRHDLDKTSKMVWDKKLAEKVLIEQLYFCFHQCCPRLFKKDIYYNMAKIMLWLRGSREEKTRKQISVSAQLITTEANRIHRNRLRRRCPGGLQPDSWPLIVFSQPVSHQ